MPRFRAYVAGPGIFVVAVLCFIKYKPLFFPLQSDGSAAGLVIPVLMWAALLGGCLLGVVVIVSARNQIALANARSHGPKES